VQESEKVGSVVGSDVTVEDEAAARVPTDEWTAAALAHASILLTPMLGLAGGVGALVGLAVPLVMHLGYRQESRFVAFQALQSFVYQATGAVLTAILAALTAAVWTISGWLAQVLIGFLLIPPALSLTLLLVSALLAWVGYGLYAAYQVYQGRDFHYILIGEWLEKEMKA